MTTDEGLSGIEKACWEALERVVDPELGLDVVSLGLIYSLAIEGSSAKVEMTMTSPGCPVADELLMRANNEILKVPGVESAEVRLVWSPPWTPEMMSIEAKMALGLA